MAKWFRERIASSASNTFDKKPDKLNFALMGTLTIDLKPGPHVNSVGPFTFEDIMIAQGSTGAANNWWFGGESCNQYPEEDHTVYCWGVDAKGGSVKFLFTRGGSIVGTVNEVETKPLTFINMYTWLSEIPDTSLLNDIVIPASHDSGMSEVHHCTITSGISPWVLTQSLDIGEQANAGVRYFDIRVDYNHGELVTYHRNGDGYGCNGQSVADVLEQALYFLAQRTSEFIILKFSHVRTDENNEAEIKEKLNEAVLAQNVQNRVYTSTHNGINLADQPIKDLRGKLILVFDYSDYIDTNQGKFRYRNGTGSSGNLNVYD